MKKALAFFLLMLSTIVAPVALGHAIGQVVCAFGLFVLTSVLGLYRSSPLMPTGGFSFAGRPAHHCS
jgi:hypothetical protein